MSNPESFIDEVTEEVRRDRLYGVFRKYGWIGLVAILGIVGGTAFVQWQKASSDARAQAFGDAILETVDLGTPEERAAALAAIPTDGLQGPVRDMLTSSVVYEDKPAALAALDRVIADAKVPSEWRDLAVLRRVVLVGADQPLAERRTALEEIAQAGRPYRAMAAEQLAYLLIEEGKLTEAVEALTPLTTAVDASQALRSRVMEVAAILGAQAAAVAPAPSETETSAD